MSPSFPLMDVEFFDTRLLGLPENLHKLWPQHISFEQCQLDHVPRTLSSFAMHVVSLVANNIRQVPVEFLKLSLAGNPI